MAEIPISNRSATLRGVSISVLFLAFFGVVFRLLARRKLSDGYKWDDLFVILSLISTLLGTTFVNLTITHGLGQHMSDLPDSEKETYLYYTFLMLLTYGTSTALIKVSIIFQYLRMASSAKLRNFRRMCYVMLGIIIPWGTLYFFLMMFSCSPISGFWEISNPNSTCRFFGSRKVSTKLQTYISQAATNMAFDVIIFLMPIPLFNSAILSRRSRMGSLAILTLGLFVVLTSVLRLVTLIKNRLGLHDDVYRNDPTWYTAITIIWSCLEVNLAVACASIPIFWPIISQYPFVSIFVVNEVVVNSEPRRSHTIQSGSSDEQELALNLSWQDAGSKACISTR